MSATSGSLKTFLEEFYKVDTTKIIENIYHTRQPSKEDDDPSEREVQVYFNLYEPVTVISSLHILDFPMEVCMSRKKNNKVSVFLHWFGSLVESVLNLGVTQVKSVHKKTIGVVPGERLLTALLAIERFGSVLN